MGQITKARCPTCPLGPIDPYKSFQHEILATWVTLEAKNVLMNPLRHGDFRLKKTLSSDHLHLGPIEHLTWPPSPNLDVRHVPYISFINTIYPSLKLQSPA